jgi:putative ABC transport system permease protein
MRRFLLRLANVFRRETAETNLAREIAAHLTLIEDDFRRRGMTAGEARFAAKRAFGGIAQTKEFHRDARSFLWLDDARRDLGHAFRTLRKSPGFTATAVLTLALGIGANTAVFSVVDAVILRPLPYPDPGRIVSLWESHEKRGRGSVSVANLAFYSNENRTLAGVAGYAVMSKSLTSLGSPEQVLGEAVTANMFAVRGVQPALGRGFLSEEDRPGSDRVVVVTDRFWRGHLNSDPGVLGRRLTLDGDSYAVVGVMPAAACGCMTDVRPSLDIAFLKPAAYSNAALADHGSHDVDAVARLQPGVSLAQAQADLDGIMQGLAKRHPGQAAQYRVVLAPLQGDVVRDVRRSLVVLLGAVGLVLLIACVNVANLLLVRVLNQRRELAIRRALGASRARIIAEITTRAVALSLLGGAAGLLCGIWTRDLLVGFAPAAIPRLQALTIDARVLLFTLGLSLLTGVLSGLLPAWAISREDQAESLRVTESSGSSTRSVLRWRGALTAAEIAAAIVLAVGAGLLIRSLITISRVDLGFQTARVLTLRVALPAGRYPDAPARLAFFEELSARAQRLPGVASTGFANGFPLLGGWGGSLSLAAPAGPIDVIETGLQAVSPAYFATLGIPLLRGRALSVDDRQGSTPVAVVSRAFADRYAPGGDPIGWQFTRDEPPIPLVTIVGVVDDIRRGGKGAAIDPQVYLPAAQTTSYAKNVRLSAFAVKADADPTSLTSALQRKVWAIDKDQPITNVRTLDEVLSTSLAERRFNLGLLAAFALLAVGLAVIGVYGVVSYTVAQRTREIGIRVALGASPRAVIGLVLGSGVRWTLTGVAAGLVASAAVTRALLGMLFGVTPLDPTTFIAASSVFALVAALASYLPARRAAKVDPLIALRYE